MAWKAPQMTSAVRTSKLARGFTLIEIVIVLAISAIVLGGAAGMLFYSSDERVLRNASGEIELLAKRARTTAILLQTPYALEFREKTVNLLPFAEAGQEETRLVSGARVGGEKVELESAERWQYSLEDGVEVSVKRWNASEFLDTKKDAVHVWRFDPNGLCEPLSVRLTTEKSWSEDTYHPLTATIRDSQLEAR